MAYTDPRHHTARFGKMPEGFTRHSGKKAPIRGDVYVELVHRTDEGFGISPRIRAKFIGDEQWATPAKTLGSIAGWRLAPEAMVQPETQASIEDHRRKMAALEAAREAEQSAPE